MNINYKGMLVGFLVAGCFMYVPVQAATPVEEANTRHYAGEITHLDLKRGIVQVKSDDATHGDASAYRINQNETRVTDLLDKEFLSINSLQVGQYIVVDVVNGQEDKIVSKITAYPYLAPGLQQAFGSLQAIDTVAGTLTMEERFLADYKRQKQLSYFIFEPSRVQVMKYPSPEPVMMVFKSGDSVRVIYVVKEGEKHAQSITYYTPETTRTAVTTTTTTTTTN